jgi:hypothetical protein
MVEPTHVRHGLPPKPTKAAFQVPPPARPIPGITGNPPLPAAVPIIINNPTPMEAKMLKQAGWQPGMAIPSDMAQRLATAQKAAQESLEEMPLPVPPDTPPLEIPPETDISKLPPAKQREVIEAMAAMKDAQSQFEQLKQARRQPQPQYTHPSVAHAVQEAEQALRAPPPPAIPVVDDRQQETYTDTEVPKQAPNAAFNTASEAESNECVHCGWDRTIPDTVIPTDVDKQNFLQAILGNIPFQKTFELYAGQLQITARTLRADELDLCYRQCYVERRRGEIQTEKDFWESLMRNRACLQLVDVRSGQMVHDMPKSVKEWANGREEGEGEDTTVKDIRAAVYADVLCTETMARNVGAVIGDFNRLVSKLEANAANPDFWAATSSST